MTVPEFMPMLSWGGHRTPEDGACAMEYVSFLAGEDFTDSPACVHQVLAFMARSVNDDVSDEARQKLLEFLPDFMGTADFEWPWMNEDGDQAWCRLVSYAWFKMREHSESHTEGASLDIQDDALVWALREIVLEFRKKVGLGRAEGLSEEQLQQMKELVSK